MRRFLKTAGLVSAAALVTYLFDPDQGRSRRARLADQLTAKGRDVTDAVSAQAEYQKGVFEGVAHEVASVFEKEGFYDDETLLQKIRSEAVGPSGVATGDIEIDVSDGNVRLTGSIADPASRRRLVELVEKVDGVKEINDTLTTAS